MRLSTDGAWFAFPQSPVQADMRPTHRKGNQRMHLETQYTVTRPAAATSATRLAVALAPLRHALHRSATRLNAWWDHLATTGQLGPSRERDLGRHTGARI